MLRYLILGLAWTAVVVAVFVYWPWPLPDEGCARLILRPPACDATLAQLNDRIWWTQTLPMLAFVASGYVIVGMLAIRQWRRRRPGQRTVGQEEPKTDATPPVISAVTQQQADGILDVD